LFTNSPKSVSAGLEHKNGTPLAPRGHRKPTQKPKDNFILQRRAPKVNE